MTKQTFLGDLSLRDRARVTEMLKNVIALNKQQVIHAKEVAESYNEELMMAKCVLKGTKSINVFEPLLKRD